MHTGANWSSMKVVPKGDRRTGGLTRRFLDCHDLIHTGIVNYLLDAARPANPDFPDVPVRSQPEMHTAVAGRRITDGRGYFIPLRLPIFGGDVNLRPDAHAIAFCSH